jgi:hypothetical protein
MRLGDRWRSWIHRLAVGHDAHLEVAGGGLLWAHGPDDKFVRFAEAAAACSPCAKSKRGVVAWQLDTLAYLECAYNRPPRGYVCSHDPACKATCGQTAIHAEQALLTSLGMTIRTGAIGTVDLLHVKIGPNGRVIPGGGPSCVQCSKAILDGGLVAGMWLYESGAVYASRVGDPVHITGSWRRYPADAFHRATLANLGLHGTPARTIAHRGSETP